MNTNMNFPYYIVVGNQQIQPFSKYNVSITTYRLTETVVMKVGIKSNLYDNCKLVTIEPYKTENISFYIEKLPMGDYKLYAKGLKGLVFRQKDVQLNFKTQELIAFIQMDKPIYKPGDLIKFRVVFLSCNLKITEMQQNISVEIKDANSNRLKQWKNIIPTVGVFTSEFQLSTDPCLGHWEIIVKIDNSLTRRKSFEIARYVLPKFSVDIITAPKVCIQDGKFSIAVVSRYTNGQNVKGNLFLTIKNMEMSKSFQLPFDGKVVKEFKLGDVTKVLKPYFFNRIISISASVIEILTDTKISAESEVLLQRNRYNLTLKTDLRYIKPGLPLYGKIYVQNIDNSPVRGDDNKVKLTYDFIHSYTQGKRNQETFIKIVDLDCNGMANVKFDIPADVDLHANLKFECYIKFLNEVDISRICLYEDGDELILVKLLTEDVKINQEIECQVMSTDQLQYFSYHIICRGKIIYSNTVKLSDEKLGTFKIFLTSEMAPKSKLFVYYYSKNGFFVTHSVDFEFPFEFQNIMEISLSNNLTKPGENIDLCINTQKNSFVGLLGVDQSVLLLKTGNDLNEQTIFEELENRCYNSITVSRRRNQRRHKPFDSAGVAIITNIEPDDPEKNSRPHRSVMYGGGGGSCIPPIVTRNQFPETWIFDDIQCCDGKTILHKQVPDTITSWIITGFSIHPVTGFGMTRDPTKLTVFQPFFITTNLPYSIKCGESVEIPVLVFNYMQDDVEAEIMLDNAMNEFEFMETYENESYVKKKTYIRFNNGESVSFMIRPRKSGHITLKIKAITPIAGDAIERALLVEPNGITKYVNKGFLIDLRKATTFFEDITLHIPEDSVPDSTRIEVSIIGDILLPVLDNLDKLIKLPYGCGEQNMLNFVPNIVIMDYFTLANKLTDSIKNKAIKYMEHGYQCELTYKHNDGSFSAFGKLDANGSMWLTAFVAKSFQQAEKYIYIDENVIKNALNWIARNQAEDGSFQEMGTVIYKFMQGGSESGLALTSYVLLTFLQSETIMHSYNLVIEKALKYIFENIGETDDIYSLTIATYALLLSKNDNASSFMKKLGSKAVKKGENIWWEKSKTTVKDEIFFLYNEPSSVDVELTAYALLCYIENKNITECIPIMKWLIGQRNGEGGFASTQDTIIGIEALSKMANYLSNSDNLSIEMNTLHDGNKIGVLNIDKDTINILQSYELPSTTRHLNISAMGTGIAIGQISYKYNVISPDESNSFKLNDQLLKNSNNIIVLIKTKYIPNEAENDFKSNMAVIEVKFPSGYVFNLDSMDTLKNKNNGFIKKIETKDSDTLVVLYFDNLDEKEIFIQVCGSKLYNIRDPKPAPVTVYDYYDNYRRTRVFYKV